MSDPAILLGLAIGDSLGMPFEAFDDSVHPDLADWFPVGYRDGRWPGRTTHTLAGRQPFESHPAGHWTDDTGMALALAESILNDGGDYHAGSAARAYLDWARNAAPCGMGGTICEAMKRLDAGADHHRSGGAVVDPHAVGNGTAMRAAALAYARPLHEEIEADAAITHATPEAAAASGIVATIVEEAWRNGSRWSLDDVVSLALFQHGRRWMDTLTWEATAAAAWLARQRLDEDAALRLLGRRGNAIQTVSSAVYCALARPNDFRTAVQIAVCAGGDTDTRAAITGAIMGARLGRAAIPEDLIAGLYEHERIMALDDALGALVRRR